MRYSSSKSRDWQIIAAPIIAVCATIFIGALFGITINQDPALIAAGAIVAIAMTQLLLQALSIQTQGAFLFGATTLTVAVCTVYFTLHHGFEIALTGSVIPVKNTNTTFELFLVIMIISVFAGLLLIQYAFKSGRSPNRDKFFMHLYNGFYIDVYLTRILQRVWPAPGSNRKLYGGKS